MNGTDHERLSFYLRIAEKELRHLQTTDQSLFAELFSKERALQLAHDTALSEKTDAFVSRFGRLQDTLGDKLMPLVLDLLGARQLTLIDNLDKAEKLAFIASADRWMAVRRLRNQMIHEYIEDPLILSDALNSGQAAVVELSAAFEKLSAEASRRIAHE